MSKKISFTGKIKESLEFLKKHKNKRIAKFSASYDNLAKDKDAPITLEPEIFKEFGILIPKMIVSSVKANSDTTEITINDMSKGLGASLSIKVTFTEEALKKAQKILKVKI